jgi:lipopolysaccharide/colanic/teichoic acid biosynthesis glycosyltransferase
MLISEMSLNTPCCRLGRFLRSIALDELPELINICFGDMRLLGPAGSMKESR